MFVVKIIIFWKKNGILKFGLEGKIFYLVLNGNCYVREELNIDIYRKMRVMFICYGE